MKFAPPLERGSLEKRYKRFISDVRLDSGNLVRAHCPNTGPMTSISSPGMRVALSHRPDPSRKLSYTWEMTQVESGQWVGANTHRPNGLFREAFERRHLDFFRGYNQIKSEVTVGDCRFDFLLSGANGDSLYVEIKNAHMKRKERVFFPDAVTARGTKHVRSLAEMAKKGQAVALVYVVQRNDCEALSIAHDVDPVYGEAFLHALESGVHCLAYSCAVDPNGICIERSLPIKGYNE